MGIFGGIFFNLEPELAPEKVGDDDDTVVLKAEPERSPEEKERLTNLCMATTALSYYMAGCDDTITIDEYMEIDLEISAINRKLHIPDDVYAKIKDLSQHHSITWEEVVGYLDKVSVEELEGMKGILANIASASDGVSEAEKDVYREFKLYLAERQK